MAFAGDDDVIQNIQAENLTCFSQLLVGALVAFTRVEFAGRMVFMTAIVQDIVF